MSKTFALAPRPKPLSDEAIVAFERGGLGHDTIAAGRSTVDVGAPTNVDEPEKTKRLSIDLERSLHRRFKTVCSRYDTTMLDEVVGFIERRTAELEGKERGQARDDNGEKSLGLASY